MTFSVRGGPLVVLACVLFSYEASAQTAVEYGEKSLNPYMHQQETFGPLNDGMFGESINLSTGGISFSQTDLSLPGNSALPVALTRRLVVDGNKSPTHANDMDLWKDFAFGEWELDVPYLSGTYSNTAGWTVDTTTPNARCTSPASNAQYAPKVVNINGAHFESFSFWGGISLYVPGQGEQSLSTRIAGTPLPQPSTTPQTLLTTESHWRFNCLSTLKSGQAGEGFVGLSPDGSKYYFDWMVSYRERPLSQMVFTSTDGGGAGPFHHLETMTRSQIRLYVSRIEDRFGNYVDYNWTGAKLTSVVANDGRQITLAYNPAGAVESATNGAQSVGYGYSNGYLSSVTRPDNSAWTFSSAAMRGINRYVPATDANFTDFPFECQMMRKLTSEEGVLSMTHPSGAVAQFTLGFKRHYRTNIDGVGFCAFLDEGSPQEADGPQAVDNWWRHKPYVNIRFDVLALKKKVLSGPGVTPMQWSYGHADTYTVAPYGYPIQGKRTATVTNPDNTVEVSVYGTDAAANEDQLLSQEVRSGQTVASHADLTYVQTAELPSMGFPDRVGTPLVADWTGTSPSIKGASRPLKLKTILQDGANFNYRANTFDVFARPKSVDRWSGGMASSFSRTDVTEYHDNLTKWVLGQVRKVTNANTNAVTSETAYDPSTAAPVRQYGPGTTTLQGNLISTLTYNADGTVATLKDGNNNVTTLSNWYRGTPRNIQYADSTTESAVVNNNGWITAVTDENGYTTSYTHDAMGRLATIVYPINDSTAWNTVTMAFQQINANEHGLPAGHWRQSRYQGNKHVNTYYDAMWRPVLEEQLDYANIAGTLSQTVKRYDAGGRLAFQSYPTTNVGDFNSITQGSRTSYDALDRVTRTEQDSELGVLASTNEYLTGFQTRVTNPRALQTTTSYKAYDTPSFDLPVTVQEPEGRSTTITRDIFGKPTSIVRSGGGVSATRSYVYDGAQQLCKTIEPETGATIIGFDAAGNLKWSASGHIDLLSPTDCNNAEGYWWGRRVDRTYDARNRLSSLLFPDGRGNQSWTYTPDGLPASITTNNASGGEQVVNAYVYNKRRMLTAESVAQPGWYSWGLGYSYDPNGNLRWQSYPTGLVLDYAPNALGQPTQVRDHNNVAYASNVGYFPNGGIKQFTYGNGLVHTMQQNARQLPSQSIDTGNALNHQYTYDANANVTAIFDNVTGTPTAQHRFMTYDGLDRLTGAGSAMFGGSDHWHFFTYDALDNLKSWKQAGLKDYANYVYDARNQLTNIKNTAGATVVGLSYDVQGNLANKNGQLYSFDYGNRLRTVPNKEAYLYDGHGRRVQTTKIDGSKTLWQYSQSGQMLFSWNGPTSEKTHEYIYLGGSLVATVDHDWPSNTVIATKYQHTDALGSPVAVTNEAGAVIDRTNYEPYGAAINKPAYDGIGYTGHVMDGATGLTYMQQRYYDPMIGRFLSVDPVTAYGGDMRHFNRYAYAYNNPYKFMDPDGRAPPGCGDGTCRSEDDRAASVARIDDGPITPLYPESILPAVRLVRSLAQGGEALKQAQRPTERGKESEKRVLDEMGETKNTEVSKTSSGNTIPDFKNGRQVGEIKDTQRVTDTKQLRAQREYANETGREHTVVTGERTQVSKTVEQKSVVIRRDDLGPRP